MTLMAERTRPDSLVFFLTTRQARLRKDRVSAMSNGALILKTNKISDPMRRMPWNKQGAVLGFEVITPSLVIS